MSDTMLFSKKTSLGIDFVVDEIPCMFDREKREEERKKIKREEVYDLKGFIEEREPEKCACLLF